MKLKKKKSKKDFYFGFRCSEEEYNKILGKINLYAEGNQTHYLIYAALNFMPKKEDLEMPNKKTVVIKASLKVNTIGLQSII